MRPGNRQHPPVLQHMAGQPFGPGQIGQVAIEHRFEQGITATDHIANHDAIRHVIEMRRIKALANLDPKRRQLVAHRRIHMLIRAGDPVAGCLCQGRNAPHERAANPQYVQMHRA